MPTIPPKNPEELLSDDLSALKSYAERIIVKGDALTDDEENDREFRFREFAEIGDSFNLSERDMVTMMFEGIFHQGPKCDCAECRAGDL